MYTKNGYQIPVGLNDTIAMYGDTTAPNWFAENVELVTLPYPLRDHGTLIRVLPMHKAVIEEFLDVHALIWARTQGRLVRDHPNLQGQALYDATYAKLHTRNLINIVKGTGKADKFFITFGYEAFDIPNEVVTIFENHGWVRTYTGHFQRAAAI